MPNLVSDRVVPENAEPRRRVQFQTVGESKVEQSHRQQVNINTIVSKINRGVPVPSAAGGLYGDFTSAVDYQTCLDRIRDAQNDFMSLPSAVRKEFANNPAKLIEFIADEKNREKAIELGLVENPNPITNETTVIPNPDSPEPE